MIVSIQKQPAHRTKESIDSWTLFDKRNWKLNIMSRRFDIKS